MTPMNQSGRQGAGGNTKDVGAHQRKNQVTGIPGKERANRPPNIDPKTSHEPHPGDHQSHENANEHMAVHNEAFQESEFQRLLDKSGKSGKAAKPAAESPKPSKI